MNFVSPHIAAMVLVFPFTFFVGFWLNRHVAFRRSPIGARTQLRLPTLLSVAGVDPADLCRAEILR